MRYFMLILLVVAWIVPATAQQLDSDRNQNYDNRDDNWEHTFRDADWGMTPWEVKETHIDPPYAVEDGMLIYRDEILGKKGLITYMFTESQFSKGRLILRKPANEAQPEADYVMLKKALIKDYGTPFDSQKIWKGEDKMSDTGKAVQAGQLRIIDRWRNDRGDVILTTYLLDDHIYTTATYISEDEREDEATNRELDYFDEI